MKTKLIKSKTTKIKRASVTSVDKHILLLYIAGLTPKAATALRNLKLICEEKLKNNYRIKVIDLVKNPRLGRDHQILAIPTLMRKLPLPVRMIIGDLSDTKRVLVGLGL
jgi:circadian clock protein KaiB